MILAVFCLLQKTPNGETDDEIRKALDGNPVAGVAGYVKIFEAVRLAAREDEQQ